MDAKATGAKVLLIDDDEMLREVFCTMLSRRHQVVGVATGTEALEQMTGSGHEFDVVVCDIQLPDLDGRAIYRRLQELAPEYAERMIFCTGGSVDPQMLDFLDDVGEERVLNKPCTVQELLDAVKAAQGRSDTRKALC